MKEDNAFLSEVTQLTHLVPNVVGWDPILISLVRRAMSNLIAYDVAWRSSMTSRTSSSQCVHVTLHRQVQQNTFYNEVNNDFSGGNTQMQGTNPAVLNDVPRHICIWCCNATSAHAGTLGDSGF